MGFVYSFVNLREGQLQRRRQLLDYYANLAQISILVPLLAISLVRYSHLVSKRLLRFSGHREKEHQSPRVSGFPHPLKRSRTSKWRRFNWYLDDEVIDGWYGWGTKREWLLACVWTLWLLGLVFVDTGSDYLHMTKRFGIIAASQLPLHYLLAAKSWSPIQLLTRMSHEELNPYHRLLGRIIIGFFSAHATLYANFYIQSDLLHRFGSQTVILGLIAITIFILLGTSSLAWIRNYSYLLFFTLHVALSLLILPVLWFHVRHLRVYILESALIYILLILQRNVSQTPTLATLTLHPNQSLLSISFPLPRSKLRTYNPGDHIYLALPPTTLLQPWEKLRLNPFTIASSTTLPSPAENISALASTEPTTDTAKTPTLTLLIRPLRSSTAHLASIARSSETQPITILIEGPYGSASYFPNLASSIFARVLLVAGGVGASFTMPIYWNLMARRGGRGVKMVWAVRSTGEAEVLLADREGMEIYVTGESGMEARDGGLTMDSAEGIELEERTGLLKGTEENEDKGSSPCGKSAEFKHGRPDFRRIIDGVFESSEGGKVAVLVCGPVGMGRAVRREVGKWARDGREVFWHKEEFGW